MASVSRSRKLLAAALLVSVLGYFAYMPLPDDVTERPKMHIVQLILRMVYFYPSKIIGYFDSNWRVMWTRVSLKFLCSLTALGDTYEGGVKQTYDTKFSNVPVRVYIPERRKNNGSIVFIHGGGFVLMDVDAYDPAVQELVRRTGMVVVSIDYRLAPEHIFPAGLNDCENALTSFLTVHYKDYGVDPNKVVIAGDSAGGNLATVVALRMRNKPNLPQLKLQVLLYPVVQFVDLMTPSYQFAQRFTDGTSMADTESLARYYLVYFGLDTSHIPALLKNKHTSLENRSSNHFKRISHDVLPSEFKREDFYTAPTNNSDGDSNLYRQLEPFLFNPDASPIMSPSLAGLPKTLVVTCQFDPLRDEGYWYMERMKKEGVDTTWIHYDKGFHAVLNFYKVFELGRQAYDDVTNFILSNVDS